MQDDLGVFGQVVEEGGGLVEEKRQVVFDAAGGDAVADVTIQRHARGIAVKALAPAAPEGRACRFVQRELAAGQQIDGLDRIQAALGVGVEGTQAVQFIVEEVQPVGQRGAHREQVDEAAAHRVFAGAQHLLDVLVAGQRELGLQGSFVQLHALGELEGARGEPRGRCQPVRGRAGSYQQHVQLATLQAIQGGKALGDQILVGRQAVVGQGFPVGQPGDGQCGREPGDFCGKTAAVGRLRAYNDAGLSRDGRSFGGVVVCGRCRGGVFRRKALSQQPGVRRAEAGGKTMDGSGQDGEPVVAVEGMG